MKGDDVSAALAGKGAPRFVLVSDLDHTMVQNEDPTHARLLAFNRLWTTLFAPDCLLVFSTGRSPALFAQLWDEAPLLTPDVLICSVGTELFYRLPDGSYAPDCSWEAALDEGWDRPGVERAAAAVPELTLQAASEQRRHKVSFHLGAERSEAAAVLDRLRAGLAAAGVTAKVIYSGGADVDVLAAGAGKGKALEFLLAQLRAKGMWPRDGVQVNGDSGNDAELFTVPGVRGCVVSNAHPELLEFYHSHAGAGGGGGEGGGAGELSGALGGAGGGGGGGGGGAEEGGAGGKRIHLAAEPCAGGIVETLRAFGSVAAAEAASAAAACPAAAAARAAAGALAAGDGGAGAPRGAGGGLRVASDGARAGLAGGTPVALGAAAAPGGGAGDGGRVAWADNVSLVPLGCRGAEGGTLVGLTFDACAFGAAGRRAGGAAAAVSAVLRVPPPAAAGGGGGGGAGGPGGVEVLMLQETPLAGGQEATAAVAALAARTAS